VCQGDVRNTPVELQEIKYPVLIEEHALRRDSGGAGRFRGGLGLRLTYRMLQPCKANINCDRTRDPPWGLHGGTAGATNCAVITRATDGAEAVVYKATEIELAAGDRVTFLTAGGGGYGDPRERARAALASDVAAGVVSAEAAQREYGSAAAEAPPAAEREPV
jgi:N-methylhydantoinase B